MERRRFTREFKLEAVRLIRDRGVSYAQASEDLKVHPTQLRNWVKAFADDPQHASVNAASNFPRYAEVKIPSWAGFRLSAGRVVIGFSIFGWPAAAARRLCRDWRVDAGFGADVLGHEIGMLTQAVARTFDLDDDGVVKQPIEQCGGD